MATYSASFDSYSDGQAITTATVGTDSPFSAVTLGGAGTLTATTASPIKGAASALITTSTTVATDKAQLEWTLAGASLQVSASFYFTMLDARPSATCHLLRIFHNGAATLNSAIAMSAGGNLLMYDAASAVKATATTAAAVGTTYRVDAYVSNGTGTTDTARVAIFAGDSTTALWDSGVITSNFGTQGLDRLNLGKISTAGTWGRIKIDDVRAVEGSAVLLGPTSVLAAHAGADKIGTVGQPNFIGSDATASLDSGHTLSGYQWTQVPNGAPTVTITNPTSLTGASFTPTQPGTYQFRFTVTEN